MRHARHRWCDSRSLSAFTKNPIDGVSENDYKLNLLNQRIVPDMMLYISIRWPTKWQVPGARKLNNSHKKRIKSNGNKKSNQLPTNVTNGTNPGHTAYSSSRSRFVPCFWATLNCVSWRYRCGSTFLHVFLCVTAWPLGHTIFEAAQSCFRTNREIQKGRTPIQGFSITFCLGVSIAMSPHMSSRNGSQHKFK